MKIVVTGANGFLGTELKKYLDFIPLTREDFDITDEQKTREVLEKINPDITVHLAAIVSVIDAEKDKKKAFSVNVLGTRNVAKYSKHIVYLSSDYVFDGEKGMYKESDPCLSRTFIGMSKFYGECLSSLAKRTTIIRTSFKPRPFKHDQAPIDMYTSADYIDVIAPMIARAIKQAERLPEILHIGTEKKTVYELAKQSKPDIKGILLKDIPYQLPRDCSLDSSLYKSLFPETRDDYPIVCFDGSDGLNAAYEYTSKL